MKNFVLFYSDDGIDVIKEEFDTLEAVENRMKDVIENDWGCDISDLSKDCFLILKKENLSFVMPVPRSVTRISFSYENKS